MKSRILCIPKEDQTHIVDAHFTREMRRAKALFASSLLKRWHLSLAINYSYGNLSQNNVTKI